MSSARAPRRPTRSARPNRAVRDTMAAMRRGGRLVAAVTFSLFSPQALISSSLALSWFATRPALAAAGNDDDQGAEVWLSESENGVNPAAESAGTLPLVHWRTMFTRHFRIHFYEEDRPLADRA